MLLPVGPIGAGRRFQTPADDSGGCSSLLPPPPAVTFITGLRLLTVTRVRVRLRVDAVNLQLFVFEKGKRWRSPWRAAPAVFSAGARGRAGAQGRWPCSRGERGRQNFPGCRWIPGLKVLGTERFPRMRRGALGKARGSKEEGLNQTSW